MPLDATPDRALSNSRPLPQIQSIGLPHELHADRVVADMLRYLAKKKAATWHAILEAGRPATPSRRSQERLKKRIEAAGALHAKLTPGERGAYQLTFGDITGWDPRRDAEIGPESPLPPKPWLVYTITRLTPPDLRRRVPPGCDAVPAIFVTHHCLSRATQRLGARTVQQVELVARAVMNVGLRATVDPELQEPLRTSPNGIPVRMRDESNGSTIATVVFKQHETRPALIAMTVY